MGAVADSYAMKIPYLEPIGLAVRSYPTSGIAVKLC